MLYKEGLTLEGKNLTTMDLALLVGMGICTLAYIASCFIGQPIEQVKELIFYFGIGLGLTKQNIAK
jgi:hypothetical protein